MKRKPAKNAGFFIVRLFGLLKACQPNQERECIMKWKAVNKFVRLARNNGHLLLDVRVVQQKGCVFIRHETLLDGKLFKSDRLVSFDLITSFFNLQTLVDSICEKLINEIQYKTDIKKRLFLCQNKTEGSCHNEILDD